MRNRLSALTLLAVGLLPAAPTVVAVNVDGVVHPVTLEILTHALEQAKREKAAALLVRIDTPGGLLEPTRRITELLITSPVPVLTWVAPSGGRAASAGFFVLQAGDVAAMAPGTRTGAASPVLMVGQMDPVMRTKVENDAAAALRSLTARRGRNVAMAEKTVREAKSFTETEALEAKLIELVARSENELLAAVDGRVVTRFSGQQVRMATRGAEIVEYEPRIREKVMGAITDPNIAFLLLIAGLLGIYIEFTNPGLVLPGVIGGIAFVLALAALSVLPVQWTGVALLAIAGALFVLEAKFTSHGILGAGGAVAMVLGALLLIDAPPAMRIRLGTALAVSLPFAAISIFLATLAFRAHENKITTGAESLIGAVATARTALEPRGKVFVHGEYWDAVATSAVPAGATVRIRAVEGLRVIVDPVDKEKA